MSSRVAKRAESPLEMLWQRFKARTCALRQASSTHTAGCYIGFDEWPDKWSGFFRVESWVDGRMRAMAVTAVLEEGPGDRLEFSVHTVGIVSGRALKVCTVVIPVTYDAHRDRFILDMTPPVDEAEMAEFFLDWAAVRVGMAVDPVEARPAIATTVQLTSDSSRHTPRHDRPLFSRRAPRAIAMR
jgi:hypothetical protein